LRREFQHVIISPTIAKPDSSRGQFPNKFFWKKWSHMPVLKIFAPGVAAFAVLAASLSCTAQATKKLNSAATSPTTADAKVPIALPYTTDMATQAHLDPKKPQLSTSGFLSQENPPLASSECLLAQTILGPNTPNGNLTADQAKILCASHNIAATPKQIADAKGIDAALKHGKSTPTIDYALIHVVRWDIPSGGDATKVAPAPSGNWYLFDRGNYTNAGSIIPWKNAANLASITDATHMLGSKNVAFLAIHLGIDNSCKISYDLASTHTTPLNQQHFVSLVQIAVSLLAPTKAAGASANKTPPKPQPEFPSVGVWGGEVIVTQDRLPANLALTPSMSGTVRALTDAEIAAADNEQDVVATCLPAAKSDAKTAEKPAAAATAAPSTYPLRKKLSPVLILASHVPSEFYGGISSSESFSISQQSTAGPPKDAGTPTAAGGAGKDPLTGLAVTVPNEGTHHFDFSIAMPVSSYRSLKYDSTNNLLVPKTTTSLNPYALADWYPIAVDLAGYNGKGVAISMPKLTTGVPIGNQPLQKPFVGVGFVGTIRSFHFQPIVGLHIQREVRVDSPTTKTTHTEWHSKLQVMVGFSISDAKKVLGIK
jgi:hypothetical protein